MIKLALDRYIGQEFLLKPGQSIHGLYPSLNGPGSLGIFISNILPNALVIAGLIGFFLLLAAGIAYIVEAGKGNQDGVAKVLKWINSIFIGLIIVFVSWWLVKIVQVISGASLLSP